MMQWSIKHLPTKFIPIRLGIKKVKMPYSINCASIKPNQAIKIILKTKESDCNPVFINPYTGVILNPKPKPSLIQKLFGIIYPLHYSLLGGDIGTKFVGIVGLLFTILSITGIILWSGWRNLITGFKIKWNAHPKRLNFDMHR
jgi:uncharacterized iron-regulated membrane protein